MSISNSALPPAPAQVETLPALPRGLLTLFTGEDGHLYLAEGDGVSTTRLTWSPEDFAPIPGIPFFPGLTEELEDELVFAHPTISADGQRVAAFALQPTLIDEADILDGDFDDEDPDFLPVTEYAASSTYPSDNDGSYEPKNVEDGLLDSMWCEGSTDGDGVGEWIEVRFAGSQAISKVRVNNGNAFSFRANM